MIRSIVVSEFLCLEDLLKHQQLFHYNLDPEHNKRFLDIGIKEFTEYMTNELDYVCHVAFKTGQAIGFIACTIFIVNNKLEAFIEDLFVELSERGLGTGSSLMNSLFKKLREKGIKTIKVHVTRNNESVFNFYKKFGFDFEVTDDTGYVLANQNIQMSDITYKDTKDFDATELVELFSSVGWVKYSAAYPDRLVKAMQNSDAVFSAWDGDDLIGLVSAIDDSMHVFVIYLLVKPVYKNRAIGKTLLSKIMIHYDNHKIILTTEDESREYYERLGFKLDSVGLIKVDL